MKKEVSSSEVSPKLDLCEETERGFRIFKLLILYYIVLAKGSKKHYFILFQNRLEHNKKHLKFLPRELHEKFAESGLVAKPSEEGVVQCFCCGMEFKEFDFHDDDDPIKYHIVFSPDCMFMEIVYGRAFINECLDEFTGSEQMDTQYQDTMTLLIQQMVQSLHQFELSTQYIVAKELDYNDDRCVSVFAQTFLRHRRGYKSAGDLVIDLEDAAYPPADAQPTLLFKGTHRIYRSLLDQHTEMEKQRQQQTSKNFKNQSATASLRNDDSLNHCGSETLAQNSARSMDTRTGEKPSTSSDTNANSKRLQEETTKLYLSTRCKRCFKNQANHVILPCSELAICGNCLSVATSCPSCGGYIADSIQTFM